MSAHTTPFDVDTYNGVLLVILLGVALHLALLQPLLEELSLPEGYGLRFTFTTGGVPFQRWDACQDRLGRFFGPGLLAEVERVSEDQIGLTLRPLPASPAPAPAEASPSLPSP